MWYVWSILLLFLFIYTYSLTKKKRWARKQVRQKKNFLIDMISNLKFILHFLNCIFSIFALPAKFSYRKDLWKSRCDTPRSSSHRLQVIAPYEKCTNGLLTPLCQHFQASVRLLWVCSSTNKQPAGKLAGQATFSNPKLVFLIRGNVFFFPRVCMCAFWATDF